MDYTRHYNHYSPQSSPRPQHHHSSHHHHMERHEPQKISSRTILYQKSKDLPRKVIVEPQKVKIIPVLHNDYAVVRRGRRNNYRKCLLFGCLAFVILAAIITGLTVGLLGKGDSESGECKVVSYTSTMRFTLMQFQSIFSDKTSDEYQNFVSHFCTNLTSGLGKQMTMNECAKEPTDHCQVSSLEKGSVIVNFTVKQVVDSSNIKSDAAMEKQMQKAIEQVVADGRETSLSDNNIFKQRTTQGEVSVNEKVTAKQCANLNLPENSKQLSSTSQTNLVGTTISWTCKTGYTTEETTTSATCQENGYWSYYPTKPCVDVDECASNPCLNSATCVNGENGYECSCPPGYMGVHCETKFDDCLPSPCENGATCVDLGDEYQCECPAGFSGTNCEINLDECASSPCQNDATCVDGANSYECNCPEGIIGIHCETNIDECSSNPCQSDATCMDGVNGYTCQCATGYSGENCEDDIDECASSPCANDGTCQNDIGLFVCTCVTGWTGIYCSEDFDECLSSPCQNGGSCTDAFNDYTCSCPTGYAGKDCTASCATLQTEVLALSYDQTGFSGFNTTTGKYMQLHGAPGILPSCGVKDKCGRFDGADDYMTIPFFEGNSAPYDSFSVALWFKRDPTSTGTQSLFLYECAGAGIFSISTDPGKISAGVKTVNDDLITAYTDVVVTDDEWHHVALVYDGATILLYVDDVQESNTPAIIATGNLDNIPTCTASLAEDFFKGLMDEIHIYASALSADEVSILYSLNC